MGRKVDFAVFPYMQGGPFMHVIAAKAVCFEEALQPDFSRYAHQVVANAQVLAQELSEAGVRLVAGGTDNHLMLVDLTPLDVTGRQAERALESVDIVANKNAIPYDQLPPRTASGLRLGTPAITSRGMAEEDTRQVARLIVRTLGSIGDDSSPVHHPRRSPPPQQPVPRPRPGRRSRADPLPSFPPHKQVPPKTSLVSVRPHVLAVQPRLGQQTQPRRRREQPAHVPVRFHLHLPVPVDDEDEHRFNSASLPAAAWPCIQ